MKKKSVSAAHLYQWSRDVYDAAQSAQHVPKQQQELDSLTVQIEKTKELLGQKWSDFENNHFKFYVFVKKFLSINKFEFLI